MYRLIICLFISRWIFGLFIFMTMLIMFVFKGLCVRVFCFFLGVYLEVFFLSYAVNFCLIFWGIIVIFVELVIVVYIFIIVYKVFSYFIFCRFEDKWFIVFVFFILNLIRKGVSVFWILFVLGMYIICFFKFLVVKN